MGSSRRGQGQARRGCSDQSGNASICHEPKSSDGAASEFPGLGAQHQMRHIHCRLQHRVWMGGRWTVDGGTVEGGWGNARCEMCAGFLFNAFQDMRDQMHMRCRKEGAANWRTGDRPSGPSPLGWGRRNMIRGSQPSVNLGEAYNCCSFSYLGQVDQMNSCFMFTCNGLCASQDQSNSRTKHG